MKNVVWESTDAPAELQSPMTWYLLADDPERVEANFCFRQGPKPGKPMV